MELTKEEKESIGKSIIFLVDTYIDDHQDTEQLKEDIHGYLECLKEQGKLDKDFPTVDSFKVSEYEGEKYFLFNYELMEFLNYEDTPVKMLDIDSIL